MMCSIYTQTRVLRPSNVRLASFNPSLKRIRPLPFTPPCATPTKPATDQSGGASQDSSGDEDVDQQPYVPLDFGGGPLAAEPFPAPIEPVAAPSSPDVGTLWGLLVLSLAYLHHSTTGFALPALLPIISEDLHLTDSQGALLTAGYTVWSTL